MDQKMFQQLVHMTLSEKGMLADGKVSIHSMTQLYDFAKTMFNHGITYAEKLIEATDEIQKEESKIILPPSIVK